MSAEIDETFTTKASVQQAQDHFVSLDAVKRNYVGLDHAEALDDQTLRLTLKERRQGAHTFVGRYTCRWERVGDNEARWRTIGDDNNLWSDGEVVLERAGDHTTIRYHQRLETEIGVNRVVAKMLQPIVVQMIKRGMREYAENLVRDLEGRS